MRLVATINAFCNNYAIDFSIFSASLRKIIKACKTYSVWTRIPFRPAKKVYINNAVTKKKKKTVLNRQALNKSQNST